MGSGKSFWSTKLGSILNIPSFDLDKEIEKAEAKTIAEIFENKGEDYFRIKENEALKSFTSNNNFILSTGGGAPCYHNNIDWMNANGITIWIDESIEIIAERLLKEKTHRPLIANVPDEELKDFLAQMRERRAPFYSKAKHHFNKIITQENFLKIISTNE